MRLLVGHERAHAARGSNFLLLRQKKVTKEKATPTFALIRDLKRKRRAVRNSLRSNNGPLHRRFHSKSRGRIHGDPVEPIFDRSAMRTTGTRMRAFGLGQLLHQCLQILLNLAGIASCSCTNGTSYKGGTPQTKEIASDQQAVR